MLFPKRMNSKEKTLDVLPNYELLTMNSTLQATTMLMPHWWYAIEEVQTHEALKTLVKKIFAK